MNNGSAVRHHTYTMPPRLLLASLLLLVAVPVTADADDRDLPASVILAGEEDDPKLWRLAEKARPKRAVPTATFEVGYRWYRLPNLDRSEMPFHNVALSLYPVSIPWFRLGIDAELGFGSGTLEGKPNQAWTLVSGASVGIQFPWRLTPFLDFRFNGGLLGGDVAGETAITWIYSLGIEGGLSLFIVDRLHLSVAVGWLHTTYRGIDLVATRKTPTMPVFQAFVGDTVTVEIGIGL